MEIEIRQPAYNTLFITPVSSELLCVISRLLGLQAKKQLGVFQLNVLNPPAAIGLVQTVIDLATSLVLVAVISATLFGHGLDLPQQDLVLSLDLRDSLLNELLFLAMVDDNGRVARQVHCPRLDLLEVGPVRTIFTLLLLLLHQSVEIRPLTIHRL